MSEKEQIADALLTELQKDLPLMNVPKIKAEMIEWLKQLPLPKGSKANSWNELIKEFPTKEYEKNLNKGLRIRLSLRLSTSSNNYVISIIESLVPSSRSNYIIAVYTGWKKEEWTVQKQIEETYKGEFNDILRTKHIIWTQNFIEGALDQALNSCAIAIIGNELNEEEKPSLKKPIKQIVPANFTYPEKEKTE